MEARGHSVMAAPQSVQHETRVVLDAGSQRLVLMAFELFATAGDDLMAAVRRDLAELGAGEQPPSLEPLAIPGLKAIAMVPASFDLKRDAILTLGLYVSPPDGTVQYLGFYANPAAGADLPGVTALVRRLAATLAAGPTPLAKEAGKRTLSEGLSVTVPAGYVTTRQDGPDFAVHHVRKLTPLGQPEARLGIYIGGHPSFQYRQSEQAPDKLKKLPGKLLGQSIEWQEWSSGPVRKTCEAIVPMPRGGLRVHAFLSASTPAELDELRKLAETLSLK